MLYFFLKPLVKLILFIYLKQVEVRHPENIPEKGPAILAINHPNNLLDTLIVSSKFKPRIHFLATGRLFKNPLLGAFLRKVGLIPVYRREDSPNHREANKKTFEACYRALEEGKILGIYPEGTTHADWQVKRIKTGTARILLEAEKRNDFRLGVKLVPVGLNFASRRKFRTSVTINVGKPVETEEFFPRYARGDYGAVEQLTDRLQKAIENEVKHLGESALQQFINELEAFYKDDLICELQSAKHLSKDEVDNFRLSKKLIGGVEFYAHHHPEVITHIWDRIEGYFRKLRHLHLKDVQIRKEVDRHIKPLRYLRIGFVGLLGLPLFLYGLVNNYPANFLPARLSHRKARKETDVATIRLLIGSLTFPAFYALQTTLVFNYFGMVPAIGYFISLPFSGFFVLTFRNFYRRYIQNVRLGLLLMKNRQAVERLKKERAAIVAELNLLREQYLFMERKEKAVKEALPL